MKLSTDFYILNISHIAYTPILYTITNISDRQIIHLNPAFFALDEVSVSNQISQDFMLPKASVFHLEKRELQLLPSFGGEKDLLLYLQKSPGATLAGDGNVNLYIRGGSYDQNLFLLDYMPLYHVSHFGGFTSTFNADIINSADTYLGSFPSRYGGRLSSVVDVYSRDGNNKIHKKHITLGMLSSKALMEGPLLKNKSSYLLSFRTNTFPLFKWVWEMDENYNMYDLNLKLNHRITDRDRLYFSYYMGNDNMSIKIKNDDKIKSISKVGWGNRAFSLRYNKAFNHVLYMNLIIGNTNYNFQDETDIRINSDDVSGRLESIFLSGIQDNFVKIHFDYRSNNYLSLFYGSEIFHHFYSPGDSKISQKGEGISTFNNKSGYPLQESIAPSIFCELIVENLYGFSLNSGVRASTIITKEQNFTYIKPRITIARQLSDATSAKVSYSKMMQHFHLISNNSSGMPTDFRIPAFKSAPPSTSNQYLVGIHHSTYDGEYEVSLETYYKKMSNLADLKEGVSYTSTGKKWEEILALKGVGKSKGIEFLLRKKKGESTGWVSSSLSRATRQFKDINFGKEYPFKYDRLFSLSFFFQQQISDKISYSLTWDLGSGLPYNLPQSQYANHEGYFVFIYDEVNKHRDIWYHRADAGLTYTSLKEKYSSEWNFSVINIYNRKNPYFYFTQIHDDSPTLYRFSIFPIMPSISYSIKF